MNILLLAPEPFYQERGTPIGVDLTLKVLSERGEQVDVVTYHEGADVEYDHVTLHRIRSIPFINDIRPGFSWKKVVCDVFVFFLAVRLASGKHYDLVHSVEESVFVALVLKWFFKIPYVYDMDSSLAQQMIEQYPFLSPLSSLFKFLEGFAVRNAKAVTPVCEALAGTIEKHRPEKIVVIPDASLLEGEEISSSSMTKDGRSAAPRITHK